MRAVIVFESMFGNTAALAGDVMAGLADAGADIGLADGATAPVQLLVGCDLVVLAAPSGARTVSRPELRTEAVDEWLTTLGERLPARSRRPVVAVFDTKVDPAGHPPGSTALSAPRPIERSGFAVVDRQCFYVDGITGPVSPGEQTRARTWGRGLARFVTSAGHGAG